MDLSRDSCWCMDLPTSEIYSRVRCEPIAGGDSKPPGGGWNVGVHCLEPARASPFGFASGAVPIQLVDGCKVALLDFTVSGVSHQ